MAEIRRLWQGDEVWIDEPLHDRVPRRVRRPALARAAGDGGLRKVTGRKDRAIGMVAILAVVLACGGRKQAGADAQSSEAAREHGVARFPSEGYLPGANGVRLHYLILGSAPDTVVAVHGGPGAGMQAILPELEPLAENHTLIFYDQRGGGLSELPADPNLLGAEEMVADLDAVRRFFELERMTLIAHSFGSIIVGRYAEAHPERVERLVFFGAVGPRRAEAVALARAAVSPPDAALADRMEAVLESLLSGSSADPVADCREYEAIGREMALARGETGAWRGTNCAMPPEAVRYYFQYTAQLSPRSFGDWDFIGTLAELDAPLLVVYGDRDPRAVAAQLQWAAAVPDGRLLLLPGAGKAVSADRPDLFYPAVDAFLGGEWPARAEDP